MMALRHFRRGLALGWGLLVGAAWAEPEGQAARERMVGSALLEERAYRLLEELSDGFGPRMVGTPGHAMAMDYLEGELKALGLETRRQAFTFPGWRRGEAKVELVEPLRRSLRVAALGYVEESARLSGRIEYIGSMEDLEAGEGDLADSIALVKQNLRLGRESYERLAEQGVVGALLINRVAGGQLLARVANHKGEPAPFPVLSVTQEEGLWMKRLLEDGVEARVSIEVEGATSEVLQGVNLIASLPGDSGEKVVLGGHFDSWDLGQGAIDNGLGVAQIFEAARLLAQFSPENRHAVEFVWFDAEELGLWGSRHYAEEMDPEEIRVMVNLDMVGRPIAVNAMGFDGLVPRLEGFAESLGSWSLEKAVENKPWLGSDHHPFILRGVPAITFNAPVDHESVRYYHDFADTFDKVDGEMLAESSAIVALLVHRLANETSAAVPRLSEEETAELLRKAGLEERMRKAGQWPFGEE